MKKSLIALAALAAVGAVSAQSSVSMYGRIDMGWGVATTKAANGTQDKTTGLVDGVQTSNAIGFRGTEDLGGGLVAGFNLEQGISPTQSNGWNQRLVIGVFCNHTDGHFSRQVVNIGRGDTIIHRRKDLLGHLVRLDTDQGLKFGCLVQFLKAFRHLVEQHLSGVT
jgi:hypothetical protein